jgi:hypothetical protein
MVDYSLQRTQPYIYGVHYHACEARKGQPSGGFDPLFETGWASKAKWLPKHVSILHAEIYPSVRDRMPDDIKDRGQVRAMWQWARDLDGEDLLWREFCRPIEVETGSKEDLAIQLTEGWILGASPTVIKQ